MSDEFAYKRDEKLQKRLSAEVDALAKLPGNATCADCGDPQPYPQLSSRSSQLSWR